jgi:hypothetical protein
VSSVFFDIHRCNAHFYDRLDGLRGVGKNICPVIDEGMNGSEGLAKGAVILVVKYLGNDGKHLLLGESD